MHHTKCRILIVDDYQPIRETMRSLLTLHDDIQVIGEAADGNEAIQMVTACRPDVILMDLNMPKRNGIDAAQEIKKAWKEAVIIGVCAVRDEYISRYLSESRSRSRDIEGQLCSTPLSYNSRSV